MSQPLSRRAFLALGLGALAWSCTRQRGPRATPASRLTLVPVTTELAVGDRRWSFALLQGQKPYDLGRNVRAPVSLRRPDGQTVEVEAVSQSITLGGARGERGEGAEVHEIFVFRTAFDTPGVWDVTVRVGGRTLRTAVQVLERSTTVMRGQRAIPSQSPTFADPRGVNPICTREPPCSMHDVTIAQALGAGRPAVITFATPKFCTSRTCGPVVDIVESVKGEVGARASFVHVEVWKDEASVGTQTSPTFAEWKLETEPWVFFVGPDGVVRDRWSGAMGRAEVREAVDQLLAGAL